MRPNITREEALFIAEALRSYGLLMGKKQEEMEAREWKIAQYRKIMLEQGTREGIMSFREEKQRLSLDEQQHYYEKHLVASALTRRFKAMATGGRLRSGWIADYNLKILITVPKTLKKVKS